MLKSAAIVFGVVFVAVGILGFVPGITVNNHLFGIFMVDTVHNLVHIASGAAALYAGYASEHAARWYFRIFGAVYGLVAVIGIFYMDRPLLGIMAHNRADVVLHFLIASSALVLGFVIRTPAVKSRRK